MDDRGYDWNLAAAFERAPHLVSALAPLVSPHNTPQIIVIKARTLLESFAESEKIEILNAHPRIGADATTLSTASLREQGGPEEKDTTRALAVMNDEYEKKFGFRFVVFVAGRPKSAIVPILNTRLYRPRADELATGVEEFLAISLDRLERQMATRPPHAEISYGKMRVVFFRLSKRSAPPFAASVTVDVFGEKFLAAYTEGDNREVVATDTMKNFVYATAADFDGGSPEQYVMFLGQRLLQTYPQLERIRVTAHEVPLDPAHHITPISRTSYSPPPLGPRDESDVVFRLTRGDVVMSEADFERRAGEIVTTAARSGIEGMRLLKTTGSSFASFARDEYTSLPELTDRPLTIRMDVHWRYADLASGPIGQIPADHVRRAIELTFHDLNSRSIQHLVHEIGARLLKGFPALSEVEFATENHTPDVVAEGKGDVRVFAEPRQTFGKIGLVLRR